MFNILLLLILVRPFLSSFAYPLENLIYSVTLLVFLLFYILFNESKDYSPVKIFKYPAFVFIFSLLLGFFLSGAGIKAREQLLNYCIYFLSFIAVSISSSEEKNNIIRMVVISGAVVTLFAVYQYFIGFNILAEYIRENQITNNFLLDSVSLRRVFFPFSTPNLLAGFFIMVIPLIYTIKNNSKWRCPVFLSMAAAFLLTRSLGAVLSIVLASAAGMFYLTKDLGIKKTVFLAGIVSCFVITVYLWRLETVKNYFLPRFSLVIRMGYWLKTLEMIKNYPILGIGLGNFNLPLTRYAHNLYLQIWAEQGILGLGSFLWFIGIIVFRIVRKVKSAVAEERRRIIFLAVALVAFLLHNLVDFTFFAPEVCFLWWIVLGVLI